MSHQELADTIANARKTREQCDVAWPAPADTDSALAIQSEVVAAHGSPVKGWKVGATNATAQKNFGLDGPFFGPMVEAGFADDGATLPAAPTVLAVEPEYAFKMARNFPNDGEEITEDSVADAVASCHVALEVIGRCVKSDEFQNGLGLTIDFAGNSSFIAGPKITNWRDQDLVNTPVEGRANGETVQSGSGADVMGSPLTSLTWLARSLAARGMQLKEGEWVSTGTCTPPVPAKQGTTVSAKFGDLGEVSVNFS